MKQQCSLIICLLSLAIVSLSLSAQNLEVEGKARITVMDTVFQDSFLVVRQPDGTLAELEFSSVTNNFMQTPGSPKIVGSVGLGGVIRSVYVSGRYAYVTDNGLDSLYVIDVSDPSAPSQVGSLGIGMAPYWVQVSGRYAYLVDNATGHLSVIDVSDPSAPSQVGNVDFGTGLLSVYVSSRYAYVTDGGTDSMRVVDVSDPGAPRQVGAIRTGTAPISIYVFGRYAYVVDEDLADLRVIDISDPGAPNQVGIMDVGSLPASVYVSGRYAYVVDYGTDSLYVIDVSDPSAPSETGRMGLGQLPYSVFVTGRYAYVSDLAGDLKVIDVSDPTDPTEVSSIVTGGSPRSVHVSGQYAYVVNEVLDSLLIIDVSGAEVTSMIAHSLEAGHLQVRNNIIAQGHLQVTTGVNIGSGGLYSDGNVGITGHLALANDIPPASSPANLVQLYAEDVVGSSELKVRDEADNITTLSPHNFSLLGEPSEPMAWSFYSENRHGKINVDMLKAIRTIERISGETLVTIVDPQGNLGTTRPEGLSLADQVEILQKKNQELEEKVKTQEKELARIKEKLGLQ